MQKTGVEIACDQDRLRPEKSEVFDLVCNNEKAASTCSWAPRDPLREGLEKTIAWIESHQERFKAHLYNL